MKRILAAVCVLLVTGAVLAENKAEDLKAYTTHLWNVDIVELLTLDSKGSNQKPPILDIHQLGLNDAKEFLKVWNSLKYDPSFSKRCHGPVFGVRFYRQGKMLAYASICWKCNNIRITGPGVKLSQGFDTKDPEAEKLLTIFKTTFPNFKINE
jgi:hypothetical protein